MRLSHGGDHGIEGRGGVPPEPQTAVSSPSRAEVHRRKRATVLSPRCPSPPRTQGSGRVFRARRAAPSGCAPLLPPSRSSHDGRDLRNPLPLIFTPQLPSRPFSELVSLESERRLPRQSPALPSPVPRLKFSPHTHVGGPGSQMLSSAPGPGVGHRDPHGGSVGVQQQQQQDTPHRPGFAPSPNSELLGSGTPAPPYRGPRSGSVEGRGVHGGVRASAGPAL